MHPLLSGAAQNVVNQQGAQHAGIAGSQMWPNQAATPVSMADIVANAKKRLFAQAEILEHIEAQMRMDLWKNEPVHKQIFEDAMNHALQRILAT
jgi:hypothetical protein